MKYILLILFTVNVYAQTDTHIHVLSSSHNKTVEYLKAADKNGIKKSFVFSFSYASAVRSFPTLGKSKLNFHQFIKQQNDYVASLQKKYPKRVAGFCSVPWGYRWATNEIKRCATKLKLKGLKVYPLRFYIENGKFRARIADFAHNRVDYDFHNRIIKAAGTYNLIYGIHSSSITMGLLDSFLYYSALRDFPKMKVIFLHGFEGQPLSVLNNVKTYMQWDEHKRLYIELSQAFNNYKADNPLKPEWIRMLKYFGVPNILFGSDTLTMFSTSEQDKHLSLYQSIFTPLEMKEILVKNPLKLLTPTK